MADKSYFCPRKRGSSAPGRKVLSIGFFNMKKYIILIFLAFATCAVTPATAQEQRRSPSDTLSERPAVANPHSPTKEERARLKLYLKARLAASDSAEDSLKIMYDLFDLGPHSASERLIKPIYDLAVRTGNFEAEMDMLRNYAHFNIDSLQLVQDALNRARASNKDNSLLAKETILFIRLLLIKHDIKKNVMLDAPVESHLRDLIARFISNPPSDPYERFEVLYAISAYIGNMGEGTMLEEYTTKLQDALAELPLSTGAIRNAIYGRNAASFTNFGLYRRALDSDRSLLRIIDSMEVNFARKGRIYRNYDVSRYDVYLRMLANSAGLRRPEVDRLWNAIVGLAERNEDVANTLESDKRAEIYYLMATEQYEKAVPMILERLNNPAPLPYRERFYNDLITAAERTGNKDVLLKSYRVYSKMLRQRLDNRQSESIRELSIAYSVNDMKEEKAQMQRELDNRRLMMSRIVVILSLVLVVFLGLVIFILLRQQRRAKASAKTIERINASLIEERDKLEDTRRELIAARDEAKSSDKLKTDFINNMSHEIRTPLNTIAECSQLIVDCIPDDKKPFLDRFGRVIELNVALMMRLVNDVLDVASLESKQLSVELSTVPVLSICNFAIDNTLDSFNPDVQFVFNPTDEISHLLVTTDRQRVSQVLINLLSNAAKFTEHGTVTLEVQADREANSLSFIVSDTGIGIPRGKEEDIFERFLQLDMSVRGCGLGLYISRLIASLLEGEINVDTSYRGGARFVFTIPLRPKK